MDFQITCPGCGRPLHVPESAVGGPAHCPHCRAPFRLHPGGAVEPIIRRRVPGPLLAPALGLLLLGTIATFVNGYLAIRMAAEPGFDLQFARSQVGQILAINALDKTTEGEPVPYAAGATVGGVAAAHDVWEHAEAARAEGVAQAWATGMLPVHAAAAGVSLLMFLGGAAALRGRFYWLALLGNLAAIANVNHLCCLPGTAVGLWGILALVRDDVRPYFRRPAQ